MIWIESIAACILFTIPLLRMSRNPLATLHDYPPAIIEKVKQLGLADDTKNPHSRQTMIKKGIAALVIAILCGFAVWHFNGARTLIEGAGNAYFLWSVVNWYDALVLDCLWFCHDPKFVIPGTEGMKEYKDYLFHIKGALKGQLIGLPVALAVGLVVTGMNLFL